MARRGGGGHAYEACSGIGEMDPRETIMWLFENHNKFEWELTYDEENMMLEWIIRAETPEAAEALYYHVLQMECILENGGRPRAMDPVFALEAELKPYIETTVEMLDDTTVRVVKEAENQCAWEVIKLHAEVVKGFFERGIEEAREIHPVPDEVMDLCSEYLEEPDGESHGHGMGRGRGSGGPGR
jgi:hypothetical protein